MIKELANKSLLDQAKDYAYEYIDNIDEHDVYPGQKKLDYLNSIHTPLSEEACPPEKILATLNTLGAHGNVTSTGGRYYGFIIGGATPISQAAKWLSTIWDQCGGLYVSSPLNAELELCCERWLIDLLNLPKECVAGYVSGGSMANFSAICAARYRILKNLGWDVNTKGLNGAPKIRLITHEQIHSSIKKNLVLLGLGTEDIEYVPADDQGRMITSELPPLDNTCIVFLQAGNANSGSFDDFDTICSIANEAGAWVHIDGAFGLWAAASSQLSYLTKGMEKADSWAVDAHKTLNVPYDSGIVLCKHPGAMANALQATGEYIIYTEEKRDPMLYTPEMSRRSRVIELWATLKYLGKNGVDEMITTFHTRAKQLEKGIASLGYSILNDVDYNQVLVALDNDDHTKAVLVYLQDSGKLWLGGSTWHGKSVIRISVSSWRTNETDVQITIDMFQEAKKAISI